MNERISQLMDGELEGSDAERTLFALREESDGRQAWRTYHLIGDALRDHRVLSAGFSDRVVAGLAQEPTVLAPARAAPAHSWRRHLMPAAAGVAAAGFVGAVAFMMPMQEPSVTTPIAQAPQIKPTPAAKVTEPTPPPVPLPAATDDYLLAHQGYSPRNRLQGVAPYVRTVSGQALESKR
ncbi:MAG TPA: sigma-E factor negative regulatory protein [Burkholderiales bacterium]|nr:sigma-E factor negative regulatory protein [Burkholderiales bacterium]